MSTPVLQVAKILKAVRDAAAGVAGISSARATAGEYWPAETDNIFAEAAALSAGQGRFHCWCGSFGGAENEDATVGIVGLLLAPQSKFVTDDRYPALDLAEELRAALAASSAYGTATGADQPVDVSVDALESPLNQPGLAVFQFELAVPMSA